MSSNAPPLRLLAACLLGFLPGVAFSFHDGGVGACEACHSMHGSSSVDPVTSGLPAGTTGTYLLRGVDQSSVCLNCHEQAGDVGPNGYHVSTALADMPPGMPPLQLPPGGDFGWLKKNYTWVSGGVSQVSLGAQHGHNVVAQDYGYFADPRPTSTTAPGGTYPSSALTCISCHDPHGKYRRLGDGTVATTGAPIVASGSSADSPAPVPGITAVGAYRLLGGVGYQPRSIGGSLAFSYPPPVAVAPSVYNRSETVTQTRVAYGQGMSEWCANCHGTMLQQNVARHATFDHVSGNGARLSSAAIANYVAYVSTGNATNANPAVSYWSLVPFEEGTPTVPTLASHARTDDTFLQGPDATSNVSCLTCHRAHASGFDAGARFRTTNQFVITVAGAGGAAVWPDPVLNPDEAQGRTPEETQQSYYGRLATTYGPNQRRLCNKCHVN